MCFLVDSKYFLEIFAKHESKLLQTHTNSFQKMSQASKPKKQKRSSLHESNLNASTSNPNQISGSNQSSKSEVTVKLSGESNKGNYLGSALGKVIILKD